MSYDVLRSTIWSIVLALIINLPIILAVVKYVRHIHSYSIVLQRINNDNLTNTSYINYSKEYQNSNSQCTQIYYCNNNFCLFSPNSILNTLSCLSINNIGDDNNANSKDDSDFIWEFQKNWKDNKRGIETILFLCENYLSLKGSMSFINSKFCIPRESHWAEKYWGKPLGIAVNIIF